MTKFICLFSLLFCAGQLSAHQADLSTTMLAEQGDGIWVLQVTAALTAFEYEIHQRFGEGSYLDVEEFRELVREHLQDQVALSFNGQAPVLVQPATVKLGHETTVLMEFKVTTDVLEEVSITNTTFENIGSSQIAFVVLKKGLATKQVMLNWDNDYSTNLAVTESGFVPIAPATNTPWARYALVFGVLVLAVAGFLKVRALLQQIAQEPRIA